MTVFINAIRICFKGKYYVGKKLGRPNF